ncbi:hypothetical protein GGF46_000056, partial [Coemansia sp. RSA 552]
VSIQYEIPSSGSSVIPALRRYAWHMLVFAVIVEAFEWVQLGISSIFYVSANRPHLVGTLLDRLSRARMSELWRVGEFELGSVVQFSESDLLLGTHMFVKEYAAILLGVVHILWDSARFSYMAVILLAVSGVALSRLRKGAFGVLSPLQRHNMALRIQKDATVKNLFSGTQTVRAFGAYDYFHDRMCGQDRDVAGAQHLVNAMLGMRGFCETAIQEFLLHTAVGLLVMSAGQGMYVDAARVQQYHSLVEEALPYTQEITDFGTNLQNHSYALLQYYRATTLQLEAPRHDVVNSERLRNWPAQGSIQFDNCALRYSGEDEPALKDVSFHIRPGEHIGVVGRTGAGKSSLLNALLRIVELESGSVLIDNVDVSGLGVHDLRTQISVVPQAAALFEGTLQANLDPFGEFNDTEVISAMHDARIGGLSRTMHIDNGGGNISAGQQQLVAICRAILQRRKIVVFDEATANIDAETARLVRTITAEKLRGATVVTIAHRLDEISGCDRVLVMAGGAVAEFGSPAALLARRGPYSALAAQA